MMEKLYLDKSVYEATQERLAYIFDEFDTVCTVGRRRCRCRILKLVLSLPDRSHRRRKL